MTGANRLEIEPSEALDEIVAWTFVGDGIAANSGDLPTQPSSWTGTLVAAGTVTVSFRTTDGHEHDRTTSLPVSPRSWGFTVTGSPPHLGIAGYGEEPVSDLSVRLGANISVHGSPGVAPEGAGQWQVGVVPSGPNSGLAYVTAHNYSMERTYWINQWWRSNWPQRNLLVNGGWHNPYEVEQQIYGGDPDQLLWKSRHTSGQP